MLTDFQVEGDAKGAAGAATAAISLERATEFETGPLHVFFAKMGYRAAWCKHMLHEH